MGSRSGQFIIVAAAIILIVVVALVATIHQSLEPAPPPPPIYVAVSLVDQSIQAMLVEVLANYTHAAMATHRDGCGLIDVETPGGLEPMGLLFDEEVENLTYVYSGYGLLLAPQNPTFVLAWCTGPLGGGSSTALATVRFNLSALGLTGYSYQVAYTLGAYATHCSTRGGELLCTIDVFQQGRSPVSGLNQSHFYFMSPTGWEASNVAADYGNGTYLVGWAVSVSPAQAPIAVENRFGVFVVIYPPSG